MRMAYTVARQRGDIDRLLAGLADRLHASGYRVRGTVQINVERADCGPCDMDVKVLPHGPTIRISQSLGRSSRGCRLDPGALEAAVGLVEASMVPSHDILIVNKFGKHEAEGRGFRTVIGEALSRDIPVLVGLNALNEGAFLEFAAGLAVRIPPGESALAGWLTSHCGIHLAEAVLPWS